MTPAYYKHKHLVYCIAYHDQSRSQDRYTTLRTNSEPFNQVCPKNMKDQYRTHKVCFNYMIIAEDTRMRMLNHQGKSGTH